MRSPLTQGQSAAGAGEPGALSAASKRSLLGTCSVSRACSSHFILPTSHLTQGPRRYQPWAPCDPRAHQPWALCDPCLAGNVNLGSKSYNAAVRQAMMDVAVRSVKPSPVKAVPSIPLKAVGDGLATVHGTGHGELPPGVETPRSQPAHGRGEPGSRVQGSRVQGPTEPGRSTHTVTFAHPTEHHAGVAAPSSMAHPPESTALYPAPGAATVLQAPGSSVVVGSPYGVKPQLSPQDVQGAGCRARPSAQGVESAGYRPLLVLRVPSHPPLVFEPGMDGDLPVITPCPTPCLLPRPSPPASTEGSTEGTGYRVQPAPRPSAPSPPRPPASPPTPSLLTSSGPSGLYPASSSSPPSAGQAQTVPGSLHPLRADHEVRTLTIAGARSEVAHRLYGTSILHMPTRALQLRGDERVPGRHVTVQPHGAMACAFHAADPREVSRL